MNSIQDDFLEAVEGSVKQIVETIEPIIKKVDPSIKGSAGDIKSGWENIAFGMDDYIVRVPKHKEAREALRREEKYCQYVLALSAPLETPALSVHEVGGHTFSLHRKVGSGLFSRKKYENLTGYERDKAAEKLATFFMLMHETPLSYAETTLGAPNRLGPSCFQRISRTVEEKLDPNLKNFGRDMVREYQSWQIEKPQLVFGHFDLHDGNVGADSKGRLVGAFDFADCAIGDVHADFAPLFYISPDLAAKTIARYAIMTGKAIDPRRIAVAGAMCEISDLSGERQSPESPEFFNQKLNEWRMVLSDSTRPQVAFHHVNNIENRPPEVL